jgi:hypothetical protein
MLFAKRVYFWAGIWGLLVIVPGFFNESAVAQQQPPAITHPEYFYGFYTTALAFQVLFLLLARDPVRYRALMPACILEKFGFILACSILMALHRMPVLVFYFALADLIFGVLFVVAWMKTKGAETARPA